MNVRMKDFLLMTLFAAIGVGFGAYSIATTSSGWMIPSLVFLVAIPAFAFTRSRGGAHRV